MSMRHHRYFEIEERVLSFRTKQLEAWKKGNKSIAPPCFAVPPIVRNQPAYHFAETLALRHYYDTEGWQGFSSYALGAQYPNSERRAEGRRKVEEILPSRRLARLRSVRSAMEKTYRGAGEPDLFLFKKSGLFMFVEVKKGADRVGPAQLECIAQIRAILRCPVEIVYATDREGYVPKRYRFDLVRYTGERILQ